MCHSFLPVFNSTSNVFCVLQKSYARQVKLSCQPYVYYYVNNTLPLALAVHEISRHFWAAYALLYANGDGYLRYLIRVLNFFMVYFI